MTIPLWAIIFFGVLVLCAMYDDSKRKSKDDGA